MGKFRAHQDKSRRGREKKLLKKRAKGRGGATQANTATAGGPPVAGGPGGHLQQAKVGEGVGLKRKLKHVTYAKEHSVLICGDGDFSFTRGVIQHRGTGAGVVATSLDSRKTVLKKYPRAETWLAKLDSDGAQVVHAVDATRLEETLLRNEDGAGEKTKRVLFDRVVFNFPHTGKQRTHLNRNLIRDFFASTKNLVKSASQGGEVHVTLKDKPPYSGWNVKAMAKESGLVMVRSLAFDASVFPGYRHSTTDPQAKEFDAGGARTSVFCRARSALDDDVDESGAFPVIVRKGITVSGDKGQPTSADKIGGRDTSDVDDEDNDSDGDLFGKGGEGISDDGLMEWHDSIREEGEGGGSEDTSESDADDGGGGGGSDGGGGRGVRKGGPGTAGAVSGGGSSRKDRAKSKTGSTGDGLHNASTSETTEDGGSGHDGRGGTGDGDGEISKRGMLQPPLQKKRAAKRRAQRKKAAAAKAPSSASTAAEDGASRGAASPSVMPVGKAKSPKRKRGKYVVGLAKKRRESR